MYIREKFRFNCLNYASVNVCSRDCKSRIDDSEYCTIVLISVVLKP